MKKIIAIVAVLLLAGTADAGLFKNRATGYQGAVRASASCSGSQRAAASCHGSVTQLKVGAAPVKQAPPPKATVPPPVATVQERIVIQQVVRTRERTKFSLKSCSGLGCR